MKATFSKLFTNGRVRALMTALLGVFVRGSRHTEGRRLFQIGLAVLILAMQQGTVFAQDAGGGAEQWKPRLNQPAAFVQKTAGSTAWPSSSDAETALGLDIGTTLKGFIAWEETDDADKKWFDIAAQFERLIADVYSLGVRVDLYFGSIPGGVDSDGKAKSIDLTYFGIDVHWRYYPLEEGLSKLFFDAGLGFNMAQVEDVDDPIVQGLTFGLKVGWKQLLGEKFFLEPSIAYILSKSESTVGFVTIPLGWQAGFVLGWAF